jgi:Xaa-Pro dipeptidase
MPSSVARRIAFSKSEFRDRVKRAQTALQQAGLDVCVCFAPEHIYYFSGYDGHTQFSIQALILGSGDEQPTLILRDVDRANAEETCWIDDLRFYHHQQRDPALLILEALRERVKGSGGVGACLNAYALPGAFALHLAEVLRPLTLKDATPIIEPLRYVKSEAEIAYIRNAASYADIGLQRLREVLAPGKTELQLAGALECAMRDAGSEYSAMPTWLASGWRTRGSHRTPTRRAVEQGDPIKTEFAGVERRYHAVTMQTMWLGEPSAGERRAYEEALRALREGSRAIAVGVPVAKAERAAFEALRENGFNVAGHARFGYGVSVGYPPSWLEGLDITAASADVFAANMTFVLHISVSSPEGFGFIIGGAYLLTNRGLEILSGGDLDLIVVQP